MAANINGIKQQRHTRRTDVEESRTAAFQTLELMRPKVSFVHSPAINPQTTPNPKTDHISEYDGALLLETPETAQEPTQPTYQPAIQEMQDSTRAKEKKRAQSGTWKSRRRVGTEQTYQRESFTEPEPAWRKARTGTFKPIREPLTPTMSLQDTLRAAQEAVAQAEAEKAAAAEAAARRAEQSSRRWETLLTSPAKQQETRQTLHVDVEPEPVLDSEWKPVVEPEPEPIVAVPESMSETIPENLAPVSEPIPEAIPVAIPEEISEPEPEIEPEQESEPEPEIEPEPEMEREAPASLPEPKKKKKAPKAKKEKKPKQPKQPKQVKQKKQKKQPKRLQQPEQTEEPEWTEEPEQMQKPEWTEKPEQTKKPEQAKKPEQIEEPKQPEPTKQKKSKKEKRKSVAATVTQKIRYTEPKKEETPKKEKKTKPPKVKVQKPAPPAPKPIPNQEAEIRTNINLLRNAVFFRTVVLSVLTAIETFLAIGESNDILLYPALTRLLTVRGYCVIPLLLGLVTLFVSFPTVVNGLRNLLHKEADSDSLAALPLIPCLLTILSVIFVPEPMQTGLVHIFLPVATFILLTNSVGKLFIIRRATRNFSLLTKNFDQYVLTCVQDESAAEELTRGTVRDYPILATVRKAERMSDFLRHTYAADLADRFCRTLTPIVGGLSLLLAAAITGVRIGVLDAPAQNIPFFFSVLTMLLSAGCMAGIPLTVNLPLDSATKRLCPYNCTLLGYQSVDDFYDVNAIMLPASSLFPKGSVKISGIKNFSGFQVEEALLDAASLVYAANSILQDAFAELVEEQTGMLYQVEDCTYEDSLGLCGWIRHRRVLLGNREMMTAHNIEGMPTKIREQELAEGNKDVLYLSVSGVLAGMFVVDIVADSMVKRQMQRLHEEKMVVILKTVDSSVTLRRLASLFDVPDHMMKILPASADDLFAQETAPLEDVSAATIHDGSFFGMARLLLEARSVKRASTAGIFLQIGAIVLILSICIGYIFANGYENLTSQTLLFYQLIITGLTVLVSRLK
jgi:Cu+-exporting ATPase